MTLLGKAIAVVIGAGIVVVGATPVGAGALDQTRPAAIALPQAKVYGYATPVIVISKGEQVTFTNLDTDLHDVVQDVETDGFGSEKMRRWCRNDDDRGHAHDHGDACPVFWSGLVGLGDTTRILGLNNVEPGTTYTFFCTRHHGMKGQLIVR